MNLSFTSLDGYKPGILFSLLKRSYAELVSSDWRYWGGEEKNWNQFDRDVFGNLETIGACVFLSSLRDQIIGFGSFDPRMKPEFGIIGHNCILPEFRRRGFGKRQIIEILKRFRAMGIGKANVSTCEHPFFLPAQRMYLSCDFKETKRFNCEIDPRYKMIEYEKRINSLNYG